MVMRSRSRAAFNRAKDIKVHLDTAAVEFLIDKGYDPINSARPMRRAVEKYLEDPLAEELLRGNIKQGDTLRQTSRITLKNYGFPAESTFNNLSRWLHPIESLVKLRI